MNFYWFKLISLLAIFTIGLLGGLLPTRKSISKKGKIRLILGNAFAGGIFLGAGLLHMLTDANDNFSAYSGHINFPIPALIAGIGFLIILAIDKAATKPAQLDAHDATHTQSLPIILYLILSIHSIIAGTSLGLEGTFLSATAIFIAIIAHKGAAAFALGVSLKKNNYPNKKHIQIIAFFALMTPLGVILGSIFSQILSGDKALLFEMIFDSLAAGTFIYIAIAEIITDVFEHRKYTGLKLFLIATGFLLMALIAIWA